MKIKKGDKIKIITGFRDDQCHTIDAEEAHKAYYLFLHPDERAVFANGVALVGKNIQSIEPDYNATMGWNQSHRLDDDDWNEIRSEGVDRRLRDALYGARAVAIGQGAASLSMTLSEARRQLATS